MGDSVRPQNYLIREMYIPFYEKGVIHMILLSVILLGVLIVAAITIAVVGAGGLAILLVFGDAIVCIVGIVTVISIVKHLREK